MMGKVVGLRRFAAFLICLSLFASLLTVFDWRFPAVEVRAEETYHEGDLILNGDNVTVIENQVFHINGSIIVKENATLILRNAWVNFTQQADNQFNMTFRNPAGGNPRLIVENASITANNYQLYIYLEYNSTATVNALSLPYHISLCCYQESSADISNSELDFIYFQSISGLKISNSAINSIAVYDSTKVNISDSQITYLNALGNSQITISNCTINSARAYSSSRCYIYDSMINTGTTYNSARAWLFNTTVTTGTTYNDSIVYIHWYLDVLVTDFAGQNVPSANVSAYDGNGVLAESKITGADGWARLPLMMGFTNATGSYWTGTYTVTAYYMDYYNSTVIGIDNNIEIAIQLNFFYSYPVTYNGDLILRDNETLLINGIFNINGSIVAEDNATLILRNALINFTQTSNDQFNMTFRGNARIIVENSNITSDYSFMIYFEGNSTATIDCLLTDAYMLIFTHYSSADIANSTLLRNLYVYSFAKVYASNCTIDRTVALFADAECILSNCTVNDWITITVSSANATISDLEPGYINYWNFLENCTVEVDPAGYAPNITLTETYVNGWALNSYGSSNITIFRSTLSHLYLYGLSKAYIYKSNVAIFTVTRGNAYCYLEDTTTFYLYLYENSTVQTTNATITIGNANIQDNAKLYVGWWLDIHVIDQNDNDVPDANVTIKDAYDQQIAYGKTQSNGWASFSLLEKLVNATGTYPYGSYTVEATYEGYHNSASITMDGNKEITIQLPFIIPELQPTTILLIMLALTLTTLYIKKTKTKK